MASNLRNFLQPFELNTPNLCRLATLFAQTYQQLARESLDQFLATPINILPRGTETGTFLAIDVGGSNLRVGFVELLGKDSLVLEAADVGGGAVTSGGDIEGKLVRKTHVKSIPIEDHFKNDNEDQFFLWIGDVIAEVVRAQMLEDASKIGDVVPVGITFSFPMIQTSISDATLMKMGKGFEIHSNLGLDGLLMKGYERHMIGPKRTHPDADLANGDVAPHGSSRSPTPLPPIEIVAITNDSVATMASLSYSLSSSPNARVAMGLIVATGTNATTTMPISSLHPSKTAGLRFALDPASSTKNKDPRVVVNTEWGINGTIPPVRSLGLITPWDTDLDHHCAAPGFQPFEYMTSGRYIGELVRLILISYLIDHLHVAQHDLPSKLCERQALPTIFLSDVVARAESAERLLPELQRVYGGGKWKWTVEAAEAVLEIEMGVVRRSARMNAAAVVGLLVASGDFEITTQSTSQATGHTTDAGASSSSADAQQGELIVAHAGGVICQYPGYFELCQGAVKELVDELAPGRKVTFRETRDGGLVGAAVLAGTVWSL